MKIKYINFFALLLVLTAGIFILDKVIDFKLVNISKAAANGDLIKNQKISSVYYLGEEGKRYTFPQESVYFSWYKNFDDVITISDIELAKYPLAGNVVVRAGTKLIKITTDPAVYAVEPLGVLRKIKNEDQAKRLYGNDWAKRVIDIPDSFFGDYHIAEPLNDDEIPSGSLINEAGTQNYYYNCEDAPRRITSANAFNANRFYSEYILKTDKSVLKQGESIVAANKYLLTLIEKRYNNNSSNGADSGSVVTEGSGGSGSSGSSGSSGGGGGGGSSATCIGNYSQSCQISNGVGSQSRSCVNSQWSAWDTCHISSCSAGYQPNSAADACVPISCIGDSNQACSIANGQGVENRTCNNGEWSAWSNCTLTSCNSGFQANANTCVTVDCSGNSSQSCNINNGQGLQHRSCSAGTWSTWGDCTLSSCNTGYQASGNTCAAMTCEGSSSQSCNINNGSGSQTRTCSLGTWSGWSSCSLSSCNIGYQPSGNNCVAQTCEGSSSQSCSINNGTGSQTRTCSLGTWSTWGTCSLVSCNSGYQASGNTCVAQTCSGSTTQTCSITNGSGSQSRTCNLGVWGAWGACSLVSCNQGYQPSGNTCILDNGGGSLNLVKEQKLLHNQNFAIPSNAVNGDIVGNINTFWAEWENRNINYSITNEAGNFSINSSGKISLVNSASLNGKSSINLNIRAEDNSKQEYETATVTVKILPAADTYFIDPTVAVSGNGSRANPYKHWSDISIANNKNYLQKRGTEITNSDRITVVAGQSNIVFGAYGNADARPKIIYHNYTYSSAGAFGLYGINNTVRDFDIDAKKSTSGIYIGTADNAVVDNCRLQNSAWGLRTLFGSDVGGTKLINNEIAHIGDDGHYSQNHNQMEIAHNYIHHVNQAWNENSYWYEGKTESQSPGDGIQLNGTAFGINIHHNIIDRSDTGNKFCIILGLAPSTVNTNGLIEHNHCEMSSNGAQGFYIERGAVGVKIRYNSFKNGRGIFTHAKDLLVAYNLFQNSRATFGEPGSSYQVYNNIFYDTAPGSYSVSMWRDNLDMRNNIFYFTNETAYSLQGGDSQYNLITNNNLYYPAIRPAGQTNGNIAADPLFVNAAAGDFRLKNGSPAIGTGAHLGETRDYYGNNVGSTVNLGIWQN